MSRKGGLGKGLSALIPTGAAGPLLELIPINAVRPNPFQPREHFDEESLNDLADSIKAVGLLQPVLVRRTPTGYELIAGERRWRASRRAGLETIPAVVRDVGDDKALEHALVENLHRQDLNPLEEAAAYQQLIEDFGFTHDEVAERVGKSRSAVTNTLRLMQLSPVIQKMLADGSVSAGHARALLASADRGFQEGLARRVVAEGLSVRAVERAVKVRHDVEEAMPEERRSLTTKPAGYLEAESLLGKELETSVRVISRRGRGQIVVDFADMDDLTRICGRIAPQPQG